MDPVWMSVRKAAEYFDISEQKLMQSTGISDKNGAEIFELDIVRTNDGGESVHAIEWFGGKDYPAFDLSPTISICENNISHFLACGEIEVIGNIYENPELLESAK